MIENKFVEQGQKVNKGDILFKVSTSRGVSDGATVNQSLLSQLQKQKGLLTESIKIQSEIDNSEIAQLKLLISNADNEVKQLKVQLSIQTEQLNLTKQNALKYENLKKNNSISETEFFAKKNEYLRTQAFFAQTQSQIVIKEGNRRSQQMQLEQLPLKHKQNWQKLQSSISALNQKIIELKSGESYTVKATTSGVVTAIQASIGQVVSSQVSLLTIIPQDTALVAELFLPSRAIGFVKKGQKILIKYDAFSYQQFGLYEGKLNEISQSIIQANEAGIPLISNEPVYRLKANLNEQFITAYGKKIKLQPGMQFSASIILEKRTLGQWLLAPLYSLKGSL